MHPTLLQINIRVFRHRFGKDTRLLDIPTNYWKQLSTLGIDHVWLMGVWQTGANARQYAMVPELEPAYSQVLPDWQAEDVIGSPYAIERYELHSELGEPGDLKVLKERLNKLGLKLILDFVPNHFFAETGWLTEHPEVFLEVDAQAASSDRHTFYVPPNTPERYFAHGKDPHFAAWQDTLQVNYAHPAARFFMQEQLLSIAEQCDGLRCDMAMLILPEVFRRTWGFILGENAGLVEDFWPTAITAVRKQNPGFLFIAEVYWDMEWELQQQGFDYTYDKRLRDRLLHESLLSVRDHLRADQGYQEKLVRFLENHDEDRVLSLLSNNQAQAAAMLAYTLPGMRFFYQGQWEGRIHRLPVQLGREPVEHLLPEQQSLKLGKDSQLAKLPAFSPVSPSIAAFYEYLLKLLKQPVLKEGQWRTLEAQTDAGQMHPSVLAWQWILGEAQLTIVVNYSAQPTHCKLPAYGQDWGLQLRPFEFWVGED